MDVSLVIPARYAAATLPACLDAVVPLLERGELREILLVDDGSEDDTAAIARSHGVTCLRGEGRGPGAARNLGWRAASSPVVWFIDSDCVAEPRALSVLLEHLDDTEVAGVGGSYGNMRPDSLLACLIHEEIVARHAAMPARVDFLATFNVAYRREALEEVGGFDESLKLAQDAELAYRVRKRGHLLAFDRRSRVKHFHPTRLGAYLDTQRRQGYWRVRLYARHPRRAGGDVYSGWLDHFQPLLALSTLALAGLVLWLPVAAAVSATVAAALTLLASLPMTARLLRRTGEARFAAFAGLSFLRAIARGVGLLQGVAALVLGRGARPREAAG